MNVFPILPYIYYGSKKNMASSSNSDELSDLFEKKLDLSNDFPFFNDENTIDFIKNSKVLFIMRGLPGSGKSTLAKKIAAEFGEESVLCSGDDFFIDSEGKYNFDQDKLGEAHAWAQSKANDGCRDGKSPVIADNTNVTLWEVRKYVNIAKAFNYIVLVVEPRTSHKFDKNKLTEMNTHNVPKETIARRLKAFEVLIPYYFGWFLNWTDSENLSDTAKKILKKCIDTCDLYANDLKKNHNNLDNLFEFKNPRKLHCTAKYVGKNKKSQDVIDYTENSHVAQSVGKVFELEISGFFLTDKTMGACVVMKEEKFKGLWGNDEDELAIKKLEYSELYDKLGYASKAHITLGLVDKQPASQAGVDCLIVKLLMKKMQTSKQKPNIIETDDFKIAYLKNSHCFVKLNNPFVVRGIFSCEY